MLSWKIDLYKLLRWEREDTVCFLKGFASSKENWKSVDATAVFFLKCSLFHTLQNCALTSQTFPNCRFSWVFRKLVWFCKLSKFSDSENQKSDWQRILLIYKCLRNKKQRLTHHLIIVRAILFLFGSKHLQKIL